MEMHLTNYTPLLIKIANKFPEKHRQDLIQEGYLQLHKLSEKYDHSREEPFETFAYKRLYFSMIDYLVKENRYSSLDDTLSDEDGEMTTYADLIESDEDIEMSIVNRDYYLKNLNKSTDMERFIKQRYYEEEMTPQEIVEMYQELTNIRDVRKIRTILKN